MHLLRKGFGASAAASASSLRAVDIAGDVAVKSARVVASTATQAVGFTLSAIGVVANTLIMGVTIYDMAKGSKNIIFKEKFFTSLLLTLLPSFEVSAMFLK